MKNASETAKGKLARALILVMVVAAALWFGSYLAHKIGTLRANTATVKHMVVRADIAQLKTGLAFYKSVTGSYPTTQQGLGALVSKPTAPPIPSKWTALLSAVRKDPWRDDYVYLCPGHAHPEA